MFSILRVLTVVIGTAIILIARAGPAPAGENCGLWEMKTCVESHECDDVPFLDATCEAALEAFEAMPEECYACAEGRTEETCGSGMEYVECTGYNSPCESSRDRR